MSRIGETPVKIAKGVQVALDDRLVTVRGPLGELSFSLPELISAEIKEGRVHLRRSDDSKKARSFHGLSARLIANMITGVSTGFKKKLEIIGVGYRAQVEGRDLVMQLGFSHPIKYSPPEGVEITVEKNQKLTVRGCDKQKVGEAAARIRRFRPPEPYKGKGIRYQGEYVRRKAGKAIA